ncbi:FAD binding domain-containing protein [Desulfallas sp. Bu1-1]|uniref:FAD binding domain-containing protein n=1 Tax=Desulfallas sp. Bu1-1 TaxID=2787620 RepID=UPI00189CA481|nr:FAD binding domain-containing protein [Desulfallas sp. Bu1-1]MBF7084461.1 FAD binding domain-containing protein [Desulfallas sp. Bu1-1]
MNCEKYYLPATVEEAINILRENQGNARLIAGGTDLVLQLRERKINTKALVDLSALKELNGITENNGWITIGSMTTHQQIAASGIIREKARVLAEAAQSIGSPQIRNVGTIGGNVVNAQPAADTTIALMALDARARILTNQGEITKPVGELFLGAGQSAIDPTSEILLAFDIKTPGAREATAFMRLAKRKALALPIVNVGVWLKLDQTLSKFEDIRIALGPMAPVPVRATNTEAVLKGAPLQQTVLLQAMAVLEKEISPRDSLRGSAFYKKEMAKVLLKRAILVAVKDLGGELGE